MMEDDIRHYTTPFFVFHDNDLNKAMRSLCDMRERYSVVGRHDHIVSAGLLGLVDCDEGVLFRPRDKVDEPMMLCAAHLNDGNHLPNVLLVYDGKRCFYTRMESMTDYADNPSGKETIILVISKELHLTENDRELLEAACTVEPAGDDVLV